MNNKGTIIKIAKENDLCKMSPPVTTTIYMRYITKQFLETLNGSNEGSIKISRMDSQGNICSQDFIDFNEGVIQSIKYNSVGNQYFQEWMDISRLPTVAEVLPSNEQVINTPIVSNNISTEEQTTTQENEELNDDDIDEIIEILTEIEETQNEIIEITQISNEDNHQHTERRLDAQTQDIQYLVEENTHANENIISEEEMCKIKERLENVVECAICIENIDVVNNCVTHCGHKFCLTCIINACSRNASCPLCRSNLIPQQMVNNSYYNEDSQEQNLQDLRNGLDMVLDYNISRINWESNEGWGVGGPMTER
jgi:hypothetical protein